MSNIDPQFLYMILVLPALFGLTLLGEGIYKVMHQDKVGIISIVFGVGFIGIVIFAYVFFSSYLAQKL